MNWRRWFRTADLAISENIEDRRGDKPLSYWATLMAWWNGPKEDVPVVRDPASKLAEDLGIHDVGGDNAENHAGNGGGSDSERLRHTWR